MAWEISRIERIRQVRAGVAAKVILKLIEQKRHGTTCSSTDPQQHFGGGLGLREEGVVGLLSHGCGNGFLHFSYHEPALPFAKHGHDEPFGQQGGRDAFSGKRGSAQPWVRCDYHQMPRLAMAENLIEFSVAAAKHSVRLYYKNQIGMATPRSV